MRLRTMVAAVAATTAAMLSIAGPASAWAPADSAAIHPGVQTYTNGTNQCTSNFVYQSGTRVFIGQAAHCAGTGGNTQTNGCAAGVMPIGTRVEIEGDDGKTYNGSIAYSSWNTMQARGETDQNACRGNDFALVELDAAAIAVTNPTVPFWGGPTGVANTVATGEKVVSYGNSSLRFGADPLKPKEGVKTGSGDGGWTHNVYTATPGVPGDSGSGFLRGPNGQAFGVLSTLEAAPRPGSNNVSDVRRALDYMYAYGTGFSGVTLVPGTEPFSGPITG